MWGKLQIWAWHWILTHACGISYIYYYKCSLLAHNWWSFTLSPGCSCCEGRKINNKISTTHCWFSSSWIDFSYKNCFQDKKGENTGKNKGLPGKERQLLVNWTVQSGPQSDVSRRLLFAMCCLRCVSQVTKVCVVDVVCWDLIKCLVAGGIVTSGVVWPCEWRVAVFQMISKDAQSACDDGCKNVSGLWKIIIRVAEASW